MQAVLSPTFQNSGQQVLLGKTTNPLLVKDDIGRAKPSTFKLPKGDHAYGKPEIKNAEGASEGERLISLTIQSL